MVLHSLVVSTLPLLPKPLMRALSSRYIAGEELSQAMERLRALEARGFSGVLDILGEDVADADEARAVMVAYRDAADAVHAAGMDTYVSVKPTHLGLRESKELAYELYLELARHCQGLGLFVRVEMEDHTTTSDTIEIFERLRREVDNVGIVLQSRLFRTEADIDALAEGPLSVRMVKGVYLEPEEIAHTDPEPIREAFLARTRQLFRRGAYVSLATHDDLLAKQLFELIEEEGVGTDRYELQVLLGVREWLWEEWQAAGHPVRVYVPYGPEWRPYSIRRLRKNPELLRAVMLSFLGKK